MAEFAPADLGAALGISLDAAKTLIGDALELRYRLPRLHALARDGKIPVWRARMVAQHTRDLTLEAAAFADQLIAATPEKIHHLHAARLVQEARLYFDPDRAIADEEEALTKRGVWLRRRTTGPATTDVAMTLDTPDAELLDATIGRIAADLRNLGDTDPLDIRRARAAGILADPQHALDLMSGRHDAAPTRSRSGGGVTNLYVHFTPDDLTPDLRTAPAPPPSSASAPPPPGYSPTGWPATPTPAARSPSARSSTCPTECRRPARPTRDDARNRDAARRPLRLPRLPTRLPHLRPRPHHRLPAHRRRRTTRPNPPRQPRTPLPHPPPSQNPLLMDLQTTRQRPLHLDQPHRTPIHRHPHHPTTTPTPTAATAKNLTAHHPGTNDGRGHRHAVVADASHLAALVSSDHSLPLAARPPVVAAQFAAGPLVSSDRGSARCSTTAGCCYLARRTAPHPGSVGPASASERTDETKAVRRGITTTTGGRAASEASGQTRPKGRTPTGHHNHRW